jgi:hypothetical protein
MTENIFLTSIEPIYCDQETFEDAKKGNKSLLKPNITDISYFYNVENHQQQN